MSEKPVTTLQKMLRQIAYVDPAVPACPVDGVFSLGTKASVEAFQRAHGLMPTGAVDEQTWRALTACSRQAEHQLAPPAPLLMELEPGACFASGCRNRNLPVIQAMLYALNGCWSDMPRVAVTGVMDKATAEAVGYLQARGDLPVTGQIDKDFWDLLAHAYRAAVGGGEG